MFHWRNGVYFGRDNDSTPPGVVRVQIHDGPHVGAELLHEFLIPPNEWASIVASVSLTGETAESYQAALHYHQFDPADAT